MASSNSIFGWNLLYSSVESDIKCNEDILFCFSHLVLVTNGFQCIGIGDSKNMDGTEPKSETLPKGWNEAYSLRYVYQGKLYIMQGTKLDDGIMINLIRADERNVSLVQLNSRSVIKRKGTIDEMIPHNQDLVKTIKDQLIDKVTTSTKTRTTESQTNPQPQQQPPIARPSPSGESVLYEFGVPGRGFPVPPVGVGRNDLDPFPDLIIPPAHSPRGSLGPILPGGGGMIFQPPMPGNPLRTGLPRGGVPPGARFDPFRPPDTDRWQPPRRNNNPDNDEMLPPGYDDMYM